MIGRISPEEKRRVVETLRDEGRYVAMIGDGVNDVPALKAARLAIAQGTGTQMAKSVADVVLVRGDFAAVPAMVEEGRKILRNLQRVTKLFVTKSVFASVLIVSVGTDTDRVSAASAAPHPRRDADDRRARPSSLRSRPARAVTGSTASCARSRRSPCPRARRPASACCPATSSR